MANRNLKQVNMQGGNGSNSPQPPRRGTESPAEQQQQQQQRAGPNKEGPPPPPQAAPKEEGSGEGPREMVLDLKSMRRPWEKTFTQRCRLFVGNLPTDISEEAFKKMFSKYGEVNEVFINRDRGFGFIRLVNVSQLLQYTSSPVNQPPNTPVVLKLFHLEHPQIDTS